MRTFHIKLSGDADWVCQGDFIEDSNDNTHYHVVRNGQIVCIVAKPAFILDITPSAEETPKSKFQKRLKEIQSKKEKE